MERNISVLPSLSLKGLTERTKDLLLALAIALFGIIGSYLILGRSIQADTQSQNNTTMVKKDQTFHVLENKQLSNINEREINTRLLIKGDLIPGNDITFNYIAFDESKKYLIDYGNGMRRRFSNNLVQQKFSEPGIYIVNLYEFNENRWKLVSSQTVTIKSSLDRSVSFL